MNHFLHRKDKETVFVTFLASTGKHSCPYINLHAQYLAPIIFKLKIQSYARNSSDILCKYPCMQLGGEGR